MDTQVFFKQRTYDMNVGLALGGIFIVDELQSGDAAIYHVETKAVKQSKPSYFMKQISNSQEYNPPSLFGKCNYCITHPCK